MYIFLAIEVSSLAAINGKYATYGIISGSCSILIFAGCTVVHFTKHLDTITETENKIAIRRLNTVFKLPL